MDAKPQKKATFSEFFRKQWSNILLLVLIVCMLVPQTREPISIFLNRVLSFSPSVIEEEEQHTLADYHWPLENLSGEATNFSSSKGEVVLLNFWATWCPPCIAEMPSLQKLYEDYGERVDFYFVSNDSKKNLQQFMAEEDYTFPVYQIREKGPGILRRKSIPTTYVFDRNGKIVIKEVGAADWNSEKVRKILDGLLGETEE